MSGLRRIARTIGLLSIAGLAGAFSVGQGSAQEAVRESLFSETDLVLAQAREARVEILAPKSFAEGLKFYRDAEQDLERGRDLEGIRRKLRASSQYLQKAIETTKLARVTLAAAIAARDDAESAEAPRFADRRWGEGDRRFGEAARELEDGDVNGARRRASDAERLFREAELEAIKSNFLQETWSLLDQAKRTDVARWAPKTLARAERLAREAEAKLEQSRYDTDEPRSLAQEARYEAQHALYLASQIRGVDRGHSTMEDVLIMSEQAVRRVAGELDLAVSFDQGLDAPTSSILQKIRAHQDSLATMGSRLEERQEQVVTLEARVGELEERLGGLQERLGGIARERTELVRRMEAQARVRERFASVERMFEPEEARVLREGDRIILRLYGLSFPVARATIEPQYFDLLGKVQQAIGLFPGSRVMVEGHTDSFGSDDANLRLSKERADAVRRYLIANMGLDPTRIEAIGYGEAQPIASNDTPEGRARNRRTDIVLHPDLGGSDTARSR